MQKYFKRIAGVGSGNYIYFRKSKGLSDESFNDNAASKYSISPELSYYGTRTREELNGSCLKQDKVTYNHGTIVNIYIVYKISKIYKIRSYPALENCLFAAVILTKTMILISTNIVDLVLDFLEKMIFNLAVEDLVETV